MAKVTVRTTYALDVETVRTLDDLARRMGVSKSEALRRAIRLAAHDRAPPGNEGLDALDALQESMRLTPAEAHAWTRRTRAERRAASARSENRAR